MRTFAFAFQCLKYEIGGVTAVAEMCSGERACLSVALATGSSSLGNCDWRQVIRLLTASFISFLQQCKNSDLKAMMNRHLFFPILLAPCEEHL